MNEPIFISLILVWSIGCSLSVTIKDTVNLSSNKSNTSILLTKVSPTKNVSQITNPILRIGPLNGNGKIRLYSDSNCSQFLQDISFTSTEIEFYTTTLVDGVYNFSAEILNQKSSSPTCWRSQESYTVDTQINALSNIKFSGEDFAALANPIIQYQNVEPGATISFYSNQACTDLIAFKQASTSFDSFQFNFPNPKKYSIYIQQEDMAGNISPCQIGAQYFFAKTYSVTSMALATNPDASINGVCADAAGDCSLFAAVDEANQEPDIPAIFILEDGTFNVSTEISVEFLYWKIQGTSKSGTILSGSSQNFSYRNNLNFEGDLYLRNLTMQGFSNTLAFTDIFGSSNTPTWIYDIKDVLMINNTQDTGYGIFRVSRWSDFKNSIFENVTFENNSAICIYDYSGNSYIKMSKFHNNSNSSIYTRGSQSFKIETSSITNASTPIEINNTMNISIKNLTIANSTNSLLQIQNTNTLPISIEINNSTMSSSALSGIYSGIHVTSGSDPVILDLKNSIIATYNSKPNCQLESGSLLKASHSLFDGNDCAISSGSGNFLSTPPILFPLTDFGSGFLTLKPAPGSLALDGGDDLSCEVLDQTGQVRVDSNVGGMRCDIGSHEGD